MLLSSLGLQYGFIDPQKGQMPEIADAESSPSQTKPSPLRALVE